MANNFNRNRLVLVIIAGILISITGIFFVKSRGETQSKGLTAGQNTKGEGARYEDKSSSSENTNKGGQSSESGNSVLLEPSGNFVSNHSPNLSGTPSPNTITSVCQTTPGAKCIISFSSGSITKTLPAKIADSGGAVYWLNWRLQDIGLTVGSWKIVATGTLNGQSKSSTDALTLDVTQ